MGCHAMLLEYLIATFCYFEQVFNSMNLFFLVNLASNADGRNTKPLFSKTSLLSVDFGG